VALCLKHQAGSTKDGFGRVILLILRRRNRCNLGSPRRVSITRRGRTYYDLHCVVIQPSDYPAESFILVASMDPRLRELVALAALAALACGLAATQDDLLFVAIFGAASLVSIVEAIRCW
jgi:hypothetical protein